MRKFSTSWKRSKLPKKQHLYRHNAPKHTKGKLLRSLLSKELRKKYNKRNARVRKGDTIVVMRGQFRKKSGVITEVSMKRLKVFVEGIEVSKKDGSKARYPLEPSNLMIKELNHQDKERTKGWEGAKEK